MPCLPPSPPRTGGCSSFAGSWRCSSGPSRSLAPGPTLAALIFVFAIYAIVDGVLAIVGRPRHPGGPRWLLVVGGILAIAIGIYTGFNPSITATALVLLIGAFVLVRGAAELAGAVTSLRRGHRRPGCIGLSGIVSIVFGALPACRPE